MHMPARMNQIDDYKHVKERKYTYISEMIERGALIIYEMHSSIFQIHIIKIESNLKPTYHLTCEG